MDEISNLWKSDMYINQNIPYLFNTKIYEYDMKEAGFSLTKEYQLLDQSKIDKLSKYKKDKRKIELGLIQKKDKDYRDNLKVSFMDARKRFFELNNLSNNDIISIKKDAIFTTKKCDNSILSEFVEFRIKNEYTSYIHLDKKLEFYYKDNIVDVKGLSEENYELHKDYLIKFICKFFIKMELDTPINVIEFTKRFIDKYKRRELEVGYYRTFDYQSHFKFINDDNTVFMDCYDDDKYDLDISYNFYNILLKLVQIPL